MNSDTAIHARIAFILSPIGGKEKKRPQHGSDFTACAEAALDVYCVGSLLRMVLCCLSTYALNACLRLNAEAPPRPVPTAGQ